jgi:thiamine biosynthesis lipoprotein
MLAGCGGPPVEVVETRLAMDTQVTVRAIGPTEVVARAAVAAAWREMDECVFRLDRHRKPSDAWLRNDPVAVRDPAQQPSDVWRVNHEAGKWSTTVDPLVVTCLTSAKEAWELTEGAFDPTVGPLLDLWRRAAEQDRLPTDREIDAARFLVGMDKVEILVIDAQKSPQELGFVPPGYGPPTPEELRQTVHTVSLRPGMQLDLGGIAKGYIAGRMAVRMKQAGAAAGLVSAAGDVYAFGERPEDLATEGGRRWGVGVQDPRFPNDKTKLYTRIHIRDLAVDTSGHYYRGYTIQGRRFSHILDPRTGRPVSPRLASVTVVAPDPALSDALATAIAVLGVEEGLALVDDTDGVECLLLEANLKEGQEVGPDGAPPPDAELIPYRSKGFAALEFKPGE